MFKRVDDTIDDFEGFCWEDKMGIIEYLEIDSGEFSLVNANGSSARFYSDDIHKIIKALQAAEQYFKENK